MNAKLLTILTFCILLTACANTPSHLIVIPDILTTPNVEYNNKYAQLEVIDMRTASHIVQILREGDAATVISPEKSLEETIQKTLSTQWQKQGLNIATVANNTIKISIEKAVISVDQKMMNYNAQSEIVLKVQVNNGKQTLTSTFKNRGNSEGPLKADIATLERNFNQRLTSLLTEILANPKMNDFIK